MFGAIISGLTDFLGPTVAKIAVPALEGAGAGALTGFMTGKDPLKQALVGGVTGGAIGGFGGENGALAQALGLSGPAANALIGAGVGGLGNYALGLDPLTGAGLGALGGYGYGSSGYGADDPYSYGGNPKDGGATSAGGGGDSGWRDAGATSGAASETASGRGGGPLGAAGAANSKGLSATQMALGALAALGSMSKPKQAQWQTPGPGAVSGTLGSTWNAPLSTSAPGRTMVNPYAGQGTPDYWTYGGPEKTYFTNNSTRAYGFAEGGALHPYLADGGAPPAANEFSTANGQHYVQGPGDGQEDLIPARLADGEFVVDATTVSRLGNGSNRRGAEVLDKWRRDVASAAGSDRVVQKKVNAPALMRRIGGRA